ncbi:MAG: glycosyltransferase family 39 protein [Cyanobacteria bacterium J06597_16]
MPVDSHRVHTHRFHTHRWPTRTALWWLLGSGLMVRGVIAYFLPPGFDEAYYFLYTQYLDWSYFDHPAAVALTTGFGVWLTGHVSPLTIRLGALLLFTVSLWLLHETGRWLFGDRAGWFSALIASISPLFILTFGTLTAPDNALIFFWSSALYVCAQEFFPHHSPFERPYTPTPKLVLIGGLIGLCCASKYHGFLLGLSLVGFCASRQGYRPALRSKWMALGLAAFGLCLLPTLYWNSQHGWISFQFQLSDRFTEAPTRFSLIDAGVTALAGVGFLFPTVGIPLWWVGIKQLFEQLSAAWQSKLATDSEPVQFLLWCGLPIAAGFTLIGGATHTYPAWPAPGLWVLTLLLGRAAATWPRKAVRLWIQGTGWVVSAVLGFALIHVVVGTLQQPSQYSLLGGFVAPEDDPSTALIDVKQLRSQFAHSPQVRDAIATTDFVLSHEFWLSGYIAMSLPTPRHQSVYSFTQDPRGHAIWFEAANWLGKDALFVSIADFSQAEVIEAISPYFQSIEPLTEITTQRGEAITETVYLYRANTLLQPYPYPY